MPDHEVTGDSPNEQAKKKKTRRGGSRKTKKVDSASIDLGISNLKIAESTEESSGNLENNTTAQTAKSVPPSCARNKNSKEGKRKEVKPDLRNTSASNFPAPKEADSNLEGSPIPTVDKKPRARRPKKNKTNERPKENPVTEEPASPKENLANVTNVRAQVEKKKSTQEKHSFPDHLPLAELEKGIRSGKFVQGQIRVSQKNFKNSFVSDPEGHRPDILVSWINVL